MATDNKLSTTIESQLPSYLAEEGPQLVAFLKAYYEWLETEGQVTERSQNLLDYNDIDRTLGQYVEFFRREILSNFPSETLADKRLLAKNIKDFYRAKGTENSFKLLFRLLFDEEIDFYYPEVDILRASDGRWVQETSVRISGPFTGNPENIGGRKIVGEQSGARALVERSVGTTESGVFVFELFIINIDGTFLDNEFVSTLNGDIRGRIVSSVGPINRVQVAFGGARHRRGDAVNFVSSSGSNANGVVTTTTDTSLDIRIVDGGSGYRVGTPITLTGGDGTGASFAVGSITNTANVTIGSNTYTVGSIESIQIISQGSGYRSIPQASVRDSLIADFNISDVDFTLVNGGSGYTNNAVVSITGGGGSGASFEITSIVDPETLFVYDDKISALQNSRINVGTFDEANSTLISANLASANAGSLIGPSLGTTNVVVGSIGSIEKISGGSDYRSNPTVTIRQDDIADQELPDGSGGIKGFNAIVNANVAAGFLGNTAIVVANNVVGSILEVAVNEPGAAYARSQTVSIVNQTRANTENGIGNPIISGLNTFPGKYVDTKGFLSSDKKLQDNFFYQDFSYVVRSSRFVEEYRKIVTALAHPAGMKLFGFVEIEPELDIFPLTSLQPEFTIQTQYIESIDTFIPTVIIDEPDLLTDLVATQQVTLGTFESVVEFDLDATQQELAVDFVLTLDVQDVGINQEFLVKDITVANAESNLYFTEDGELLSPSANVTFNDSVYIALHTFGVPTVNYQITVPSFNSIANTIIIADLQIQPFANNNVSFFGGDTFNDVFIQDRFGISTFEFGFSPSTISPSTVVSPNNIFILNINEFTTSQTFANNLITPLSGETIDGFGGTSLITITSFGEITIENV